MPTKSLQMNSLDLDKALLVKPIEKKRSLASYLSLDNNDVNDIQPTTGSSNLSSKRRKLNIDSSWNLKEVPELPFLYLKERTSVIVLNENPQLIASRIVDCAKTLSAYGQYNGEKAKATLTAENVKLSIQLFKVTEKANDCVIVEIQRTNGSSIQFHKIARAILEVAKKKETTATATATATSTPLSIKTNTIQNEHPTLLKQQNHQNQEEVYTCTLEMVNALLKKDRVDANLLGMQSLLLLTSQKSTSNAMVQFISKVVITGEEFSDIKDTITSLIAKYTTDGGICPTNIVEEEYYQKMRVCALSILSNALRNLFSYQRSDDNDKKDNLDKLDIDRILSPDDWLGDHGLLTLLIGELKNAHTNPNEAYLAARSLEVVLRKSLKMRNHATSLDAYTIVSKSFDIGLKSYTLLKSVSDSILQLLDEKEASTTK